MSKLDIPNYNVAARQADRDRIKAQVDQFVAQGGQIRKLRPGESAEHPAAWGREQFPETPADAKKQPSQGEAT